jgi:hypothetical protein
MKKSTRMMKKSTARRSIGRATTTADQDVPTLTAEEFDELADSGADLGAYVDHARAIRPGRVVQRVNVDFPIEMLRAIDADANRIGVTRQAWIKMRLAESLPTK